MKIEVFKEFLEWVDFDAAKTNGANKYLAREAEASFPHLVALICAEKEFYDNKARGISPRTI